MSVYVCCFHSRDITDHVIGMPLTVFEDLFLYVSVCLYVLVYVCVGSECVLRVWVFVCVC